MKRGLFNILTGLSLLLCVGSVVLLWRSFWIVDIIKYAYVRHPPVAQVEMPSVGGDMLGWERWSAWSVNSSEGELDINYEVFGPFARLTNPSRVKPGWNWFRYQRVGFTGGGFSGGRQGLIVPLWLLVLITAALPLWRTGRWWRAYRDLRRRRRQGLCKKCGYNLTGNISGTCPECGTPLRQHVGASLSLSPPRGEGQGEGRR